MSQTACATNRWMRVASLAASPAFAFAFVLMLLLASSTAHAQQPPLTNNGGRPPVEWIKLTKADSASGTAGQSDPIGELSLEPLRLSLLGEFVPHPLSEPGCGEHPEAMGSLTGAPAFPMQRVSALRIFGGPSSPFKARLSLFGFTRGGCATSAAGGGGLTFTVPLSKSTFFVLGGGAIYLPHAGPGGTSLSSTQARADVVFAREGNRSFTVGVGVVRGTPRVSVGGVF
jgi:hypothetical protein